MPSGHFGAARPRKIAWHWRLTASRCVSGASADKPLSGAPGHC